MIFVILLCLLALIVVTVVVFIRIAKPHSRKLDEEQTRINRKNKKVGAPTVPTATIPETTTVGKIGALLVARIFWTSILVLVALGVLYFGTISSHSLATPSCDGIWEWAKAHWFWVFLTAGILYAVIELNGKTLGKAKKVLEVGLVVVLIALFIACPIIGWVVSHSAAPPLSSSAKPLVAPSATEQTRSQQLWIAPGENSILVYPIIGYRIHIPPRPGGYTVHFVYDDGKDVAVGPTGTCPGGAIQYFYLHNDTTKLLIVSYEFLK